jgi:hypothetical protein
MLSETWLGEAASVYLKGLTWWEKKGTKGQVVVAILINNKLKYSCKNGLYDGDSKTEACAIQIYTGQDKILIVSCYKQPHMKIELRLWKKIFA